MKIDLGFWNSQNEYIEDIQEVDEMEKKEVIIDGVNVAGCEFLRKCVIPDNEGCKIDDSLCCDVGNCYFKQLQRAKEENARLKEENENLGKQLCHSFGEKVALERDRAVYMQALEEIRGIAKEAPALDTELSLRVLEVIDEVLK